MTPRASDTLILGGRGAPAKRCGLSKSHFRPSDDAATFPFLVPANAMAAVGLRVAGAILHAKSLDSGLAAGCTRTGQEIGEAVARSAVFEHSTLGRGPVYAYEVDGFGSASFMDDANVPSLLSLPYLGFCEKDDPLYLRTRSFLWSGDNPYFASGSAATGIGGPHVGRAYVWPMSILMHALTSTDAAEIDRDLRTLCSTHAGRGVMHECFHMDDANDFRRPWFCWPNALFAELVLRAGGRAAGAAAVTSGQRCGADGLRQPWRAQPVREDHEKRLTRRVSPTPGVFEPWG